jgi:hypothetical protein
MAAETPETLPKLMAGVVLKQWVRCGRPRCRCANGRLHGPYTYRFWREGGRLRKAYVRPADLEGVHAACEARQNLRQQLRAGWSKWRQIRDFLKEMEQR